MRSFLANMALRTLFLAAFLLLLSRAWSQADEQGDRQAFRDFLTQAKNNGSADKERVAAFYKTTGVFWRAHWLDYSHHPENYADVMALYRADQALYPRALRRGIPEAVQEGTSSSSSNSTRRIRRRKTRPCSLNGSYDDREVEHRRCLSRPQRDQPRIWREFPRGRAVFLQGRDRGNIILPPSCFTATMTSKPGAITIRRSRRSCRSIDRFALRLSQSAVRAFLEHEARAQRRVCEPGRACRDRPVQRPCQGGLEEGLRLPSTSTSRRRCSTLAARTA